MNNKVLFVIGSTWASGYYRLGQAAIALKHAGFNVKTIMFNAIDQDLMIAIETNLFGKDKFIKLLDFDIIVFQLVYLKGILSIMKRLKAHNKKLSMELDDDYFALPATNPSFISFHPKVKTFQKSAGSYGRQYNRKVNFGIDNLKEACRLADMLQVSTPELKKVYSNLNNNIVVLENCVDNELYDAVPKRKNENVVVGWFGTATHKEDLRLVLGCFPENVTILLAGTDSPELVDTTFKGYDYLEVIPAYPLEDLPKIVAKCDIGIAPLVDCRFNDGKSDLKGVEFNAGSVPVIASDVAPYRRYIVHGENGFLVKKNKTKYWRKYLRELVENKKLRDSMSKKCKQFAIKRDIKNNLEKWITTYFT